MAEVYNYPRGVRGLSKGNLEEVFAHIPIVQLSLGNHRRRIAADARAILGSHRDTGASRIEEQQGNVDHYVILNDDKLGHRGAMSIEFGRGAWTDPDTGEFFPGMDPVSPLGRASGLTQKRTFPRRPRRRGGGGRPRR